MSRGLENTFKTELVHRGYVRIDAVSNQRAIPSEMIQVQRQEFLQNYFVERIEKEHEAVSTRKLPTRGVGYQKVHVLIRRFSQISLGNVDQRLGKINPVDVWEFEIFLGKYARLALAATDIHEVLEFDAGIQRLLQKKLQVKIRIRPVVVGICQGLC